MVRMAATNGFGGQKNHSGQHKTSEAKEKAGPKLARLKLAGRSVGRGCLMLLLDFNHLVA